MILFARHGETDWNELGLLQGHQNTELNENGIKQAEDLRDSLEQEKIDLIICSPLKRAQKTAEIINQQRGVPILIDSRIIERDFGEFEGIPFKKNSTSIETTQHTPASNFNFKDFWSYSKNLEYKKAENIRAFFDRIFEFIHSIQNEYPENNILIVAHAGVSIPFKCYFDGIPNQETLANLNLKNGEYAKYSFDRVLTSKFIYEER